jgi:hypothetical protein
MLNAAISVKQDSHIQGYGLVADRLIPTGEIIFQFDDTNPPIHLYELLNWPKPKRIRFLTYANQIGKDDYCFRQGNIMYMNHSCDPTAWWEGYGILTARRDINPGEEVTYDYSTTDITLSYQMECKCGSNACRGVITNKDYLRHDFQKKYANHLPKHVVEAIEQANLKESELQTQDRDRFPEHVVEVIKQAKFIESQLQGKDEEDIFEMVRQLIQKDKTR